MNLFNEYYNSDVQFLLDLFSLNRRFRLEEAIEIAKAEHAYAPYGDYERLLKKWVDFGLLKKNEDSSFEVASESGIHPFAAPLNQIEKDCLLEILRSKEAELFLPEESGVKLLSEGNSDNRFIKGAGFDRGSRELQKINPKVFRTLMKAMDQGCSVSHSYCTNDDATVRTAVIIPYRFEYSVFDQRWWLISYSEETKRPIKAKLENIKSVQLLQKHNVKAEVIENAISSNLADEKMVLHVVNERNALERCFLLFEDMQEMSAYKISDLEYELQFRFFRWDKNIIIRKLLYLGECVTVKSPDYMIKDLVRELNTAIDRINFQVE